MSDPDRRYGLRRQRFGSVGWAIVDRWSGDRVESVWRDESMADVEARRLNAAQRRRSLHRRVS